MKPFKSISGILLVTAVLGMTLSGCNRNADNTAPPTPGMSGSSPGSSGGGTGAGTSGGSMGGSSSNSGGTTSGGTGTSK
jgi:hypothetical protein